MADPFPNIYSSVLGLFQINTEILLPVETNPILKTFLPILPIFRLRRFKGVEALEGCIKRALDSYRISLNINLLQDIPIFTRKT